jgi:hypothetical protein
MLNEYLSFRKLITPLLVQTLFWIVVVANTISALFYSDSFLEGLLMLIVGPILIRIFCEGLIVVFEINNTLTEIRDHQRSAVAAPQPPYGANPPSSNLP